MSREILRPVAIRHYETPKVYAWKIPVTTVAASGDAITTEGGINITMEDGTTITTE